jgi:hypothetical protein
VLVKAGCCGAASTEGSAAMSGIIVETRIVIEVIVDRVLFFDE